MRFKAYRKKTRWIDGGTKYVDTRKQAQNYLRSKYGKLENAYGLGWKIKKV